MSKLNPIPPSEITPESVYLSRRQFLKGLGVTAAGVALLAACGGEFPLPTATPPGMLPSPTPTLPPATAYDTIATLNNYYEFSMDKSRVAEAAKNFHTRPWTVEVAGLVRKPKTYTIEEILQKFPREERIYRFRCVEKWSMVIPWLGFPLNKLLNEVEPMSSARFVRFVSLLDPAQMPGQNDGRYRWPYSEGLRLDEAMQELTLLASGLYGKDLPPQNGAPLRLVVPWKYGFKSIKAVVKVELLAAQPASFWSYTSPQEYGFYANVNPNVPHPRWLQETEYRIGANGIVPTLYMNGYADEVAHLYDGMNLVEDY